MIKAVQQFMLGTVTNNEKQAMETLSAIKAAGYDGIELCGFIIRPTPLIVQLLTQAAGMPTGRGGKLNWLHMTNEAGLSVVSIHEDLDHIEKEPQAMSMKHGIIIPIRSWLRACIGLTTEANKLYGIWLQG